jgi:predicted dehydrogenase
MKKVLLIGGGNITRSRHIPALRALGYSIVGVVGTDREALRKLGKKFSLKTTLVSEHNPLENALKNYGQIDFAVIGVPPLQHFIVAKTALQNGISCLVEKPFCTSLEEANELLSIAKKNEVKLGVMHNFSKSRSFTRLSELIANSSLGALNSISLVQASSMNRRIPQWINELPGGLFFDEASHFIYFASTAAGTINQESISAIAFGKTGSRTPRVLNSSFLAGEVPVTMHLTFDSPISEWYASFYFERGVVTIDLFRDIFIRIKSDNEHYALDILKTSLSVTIQHWVGFASSGFRLLAGKLHYGIDKTIESFAQEDAGFPTGEDGRENIETILCILKKSGLA